MSGPACPDRPVLMDGFAWYDKLVMRAGLVALPQYWLWGNWALLAAFWAVALPLGLLTPLRFCRRCRHQRCPLNMAPQSGK